MFHAHGVGAFFHAVAFAADAFGDLGAGDVNRLNAKCGLNSNGAAHSDGYAAAAVAAECEDLPETAYIQPFFTGLFGGIVFVGFFGVKGIRTQADIFVFGAVGQAGHAVGFLFVRLHKNALSAVLQAITDFTFQAYVSHFAKALEISTRAVAV